MSHGGGFGGGGGGHSGGYGHGGGGGHSGYGHSGGHHGSVYHAHIDHMPNHGGFLGHGLGLGGHAGAIFGHILHALGFGHHAPHGMHSAHQPDQSPTWNQSMQSEKGWRKFLKRWDARPLVFVLIVSAISFGWLTVIYTVHRHESSVYSSPVQSPSTASANYGPYGSPSPVDPAIMPVQAVPAGANTSAINPYAPIPANAQTAAPYGYATAYGGAPAASTPYAALPAAAPGVMSQQAQVQSMGAYLGRSQAPPRGYGQVEGTGPQLSSALTRYLPEANGRRRLCVSR